VKTDRLNVDRAVKTLSTMPLLREPFVNCAYATGSLLAGLGTPTSDLDVIILVEEETDKELAKQDKGRWRRGGIPADFEVFTVAEFAGFVNSCADYRTVWNTASIYHLGEAVRQVCQFAAATRVLKSSAALTDFGARITAHRQALVHISVMAAVIQGNKTQEDVLGLVWDEDEIGLLRRSHDYLRFGLHAWCTSQGSIYPDPKGKWLWRRLHQVLSDEQALAVLRELYVPEVMAGPVPDVALRRTDTTQALLAQALLAAWTRDATTPDSAPLLPRWDAPDRTLWRSSDWMPTRTPDAWGLGADFVFHQVSLPAFAAWAWAGGRAGPELATLVVERCRAALGIEVRPAAAQSAIGHLLKCGALRKGRPSLAAVLEQAA
jgi:hypothetical protein